MFLKSDASGAELEEYCGSLLVMSQINYVPTWAGGQDTCAIIFYIVDT